MPGSSPRATPSLLAIANPHATRTTGAASAPPTCPTPPPKPASRINPETRSNPMHHERLIYLHGDFGTKVVLPPHVKLMGLPQQRAWLRANDALPAIVGGMPFAQYSEQAILGGIDRKSTAASERSSPPGRLPRPR